MRGLRSVGAAAVFAVVATVMGCYAEGEYSDVSGTVSYDGKPVEDGAITFFPADGRGPTAGDTIKHGRYAARRVPVGNTRVVISGSKVTGKKRIYDTPNSPEMPLTAELLPVRYSDKDRTELTYEVKRGSNEKNWDLSK